MVDSISPSRRKQVNKGIDLRWLLYLVAAIALVGLIIFSGKLGVSMARERLPEKVSPASSDQSAAPVTLGQPGSPVFLADTPDTLRRFFSEYPTENSRASADLTGRGVRRLQSRVQIVILGTEADAVEVRVSSGAIAGTVYWVHHSQLPDTEDFDPIISPVPGTASD